MTRIGIIGGGQLGKMLCEAKDPDDTMVVLDPSSTICKDLATVIPKSVHDGDAIAELATQVDVLTFETENINADKLLELEADGHTVIPRPGVLKMIQNKGRQKQFLVDNNIPTAPFHRYSNWTTLQPLLSERSPDDKVVIKQCVGGYDGRGVKITTVGNLTEQYKRIHHKPWSISHTTNELLFRGNCILEEYIDCCREIACLVAVDQSGDTLVYDPVEMVFTSTNVLSYQICPARISPDVETRVRELAQQVASSLESPGLFAIEMFVTYDDEVMVNEISPRPHNSGHHTIDACETSQFKQLLNILRGQPLTSIETWYPTVMLNILGPAEFTGEYKTVGPGVVLHMYGKTESRPGRKLGHLVESLDNTHELPDVEKLRREVEIIPSGKFTWSTPPVVGVIMGSLSDNDVMQEAVEILNRFLIPNHCKVVSAHRTPHAMVEYATTARSRGLKIIIAGAGGAAHLPGMVASLTTLPVIGVPIKTSILAGVDSLHSIVQMPRGVPVATMAINGAQNAGLMAARMLSMDNPAIADRLDNHKDTMEHDVGRMNQALGGVHNG